MSDGLYTLDDDDINVSSYDSEYDESDYEQGIEDTYVSVDD